MKKPFSNGENKHYVWLTQDRTRAKISRKLYSNAEIDLTIFDREVHAQEAIVDFAEGRLNLVSVSIFNRADSGEVETSDLAERYKNAGKAMSGNFGVKPRRRDADSSSGLLTEGYSWYAQKKGFALLEHNEGAMEGSQWEFLRLRVWHVPKLPVP